MWIYRFFKILPFVLAAVAFVAHVLPCGYKWRGRMAWLVFMLAVAGKFFAYEYLGGHAFTPTLPEKLLWTWNTLYSGLAFFAFFALLLLPLKLIPFCRGEFFLGAERIAVPLLAWGLAAWGVWCGLKPPAVVEREVFFEDLPPALDGYRIAHLSDLHVSCGARGWRTEEVVRLANGAKPDLICITGDFVDGKPSVLEDDVRPLEKLVARDGVYACTGNHEAYGPWHDWERRYERWNVRFPVDACAVPRPDLAVGSADDLGLVWLRLVPKSRALTDHVFDAAPKGAFRLWLQHVPKYAARTGQGVNADLILCGHTHGGVAPILKEFVRAHNEGFLRGFYTLASGALLHVSPGSGQWSSFPIRILNPSEITILVLRPQHRDGGK